MKTIITYCVFLMSVLVAANVATAQADVEGDAKTALKTANAKQLAVNFNDMVELGFDGQKQAYSKTQAEFVIKDFFKKYPVTDFEYLHQGSSKEGMKYIIGKYKHAGGSFRVYMLIKQFKGKYLIDTLDFTAE